MCTLHSFPHNIHHCLTYARWAGVMICVRGRIWNMPGRVDGGQWVGPCAHCARLTPMSHAHRSSHRPAPKPRVFTKPLHTSRSEFEGLLEKTPAEANAFLADPEKYIASVRSASDAAAREQLERVTEVLVSEHCTTFEECIAWARRKFQVGRREGGGWGSAGDWLCTSREHAGILTVEWTRVCSYRTINHWRS